MRPKTHWWILFYERVSTEAIQDVLQRGAGGKFSGGLSFAGQGRWEELGSLTATEG